jgi:uroporphyrinogen decarboxylase
MTDMTPRQRVRAALNHREPDRVAIDQGGGSYVNGLTDMAYARLLRYLEMDETPEWDGFHIAKVSEPVRERLHADVRYFEANPPSDWRFVEAPDLSWVDEWGVRRQYNGLYAEVVFSPLAEAQSLADINAISWPNPEDPARFAGLRERVKALYETTDFALVPAELGGLLTTPAEMFGWERFYEALMLDRPLVEAVVDKLLDFYARFFGRVLDEVGEYVVMIWFGDDWGTQRGPLVSPRMFREMFKPRYKELFAFLKSKAPVKMALHCCGSVTWALADFVEMGVDVLHPLQAAAAGTDLQWIKQEFGQDLVLYSGINNQHILPIGTPEEVVQEVRSKIQILAPGGGYVFSCGHNIQGDVPPQNILAAVDAALEHGRYPIATR